MSPSRIQRVPSRDSEAPASELVSEAAALYKARMNVNIQQQERQDRVKRDKQVKAENHAVESIKQDVTETVLQGLQATHTSTTPYSKVLYVRTKYADRVSDELSVQLAPTLSVAPIPERALKKKRADTGCLLNELRHDLCSKEASSSCLLRGVNVTGGVLGYVLCGGWCCAPFHCCAQEDDTCANCAGKTYVAGAMVAHSACFCTHQPIRVLMK